MATKIEFQTWSGGSGLGDSKVLIGYCKDSPQEVLRYVCKHYNVYEYKSVYRPVDHNFPNNVEGLVISEVEELKIHGCEIKIVANIEDLDLSRAHNKDIKRTEKIFKEAIEGCKSWHLADMWKNNQKTYSRNKAIIDEIESIILV